MRLIKMLGLAAVATMAAMALVGATSASAANTQLCNSHTALTCGSAATSVSMTGVGILLSSLPNLLCLNISATATPLALGNPQQVHVPSLEFEGCGLSSASHDNCAVEVVELPLATLLKIGLDLGTLTTTSGVVSVVCEIFFWIDIECEYNIAGFSLAVGVQHLTASETQVNRVGGSVCPDEPTIDGLLTTTSNRYVLA